MRRSITPDATISERFVEAKPATGNSAGGPWSGSADLAGVLNRSSSLSSRAAGWFLELNPEQFTGSQALYQATGRAPEVGFRGIGEFAALVHGDDRAAFNNWLIRARQETAPLGLEFRYRHPDGITRRFSWSSCPVSDAAGNVIRIFGTLEDISDWQQNEDRTRSQAQLLALAGEAAGLGTWEWDVHSGLIHWDHRMCRIHGQPARDCLTYDTWLASIHPEDVGRVERRLRSSKKPDAGGCFEFRIIRSSDGVIRRLRMAVRLLRDGLGRGTQVVGVCLDVTESPTGLPVGDAAAPVVDDEPAAVSIRPDGSGPATCNAETGSVINSINVSASLLLRSLRDSRVASLGKVVGMLQEHERDLGRYLAMDPRGRQIPEYLARLAEHLLSERELLCRDLGALQLRLEQFARSMPSPDGTTVTRSLQAPLGPRTESGKGESQ